MRKLMLKMALNRMEKVIKQYSESTRYTEEEIHKKSLETLKILSKEFELKMINESTGNEYTKEELTNMTNEELMNIITEALKYVKDEVLRLKPEDS